jgi:hypothetical protein
MRLRSASWLAESSSSFSSSSAPRTGLAEVGVEAGGLAAGAVGLGHRGQGEEGGPASAAGLFLGADRGGHREAVHDGHLDVEDGHVEFLGAPEVERGGAVDRRADIVAGAAEAGARDLSVDLVVFGEQDAEAAGDAEASGGGFGVVERRRFGAEARPERGERHRTEELGLALRNSTSEEVTRMTCSRGNAGRRG